MLDKQISFVREWLRAPLRVGAIVPSSSRLAMAITEGLSGETGPIIELGPGTGVFTQALLDRGVTPTNLAAIELGKNFAEALKAKHPEVQIIEGDATKVVQLSPFAPGSVGQVVCGLPLLSIPPEFTERIVAGSFELLEPGGAFRLFTYGLRCPVAPDILKRLGLKSKRTNGTLYNFPPASVYELRRS